MDDAILKKLREGYVMDLRKPDIDKFERAAIISKVLEDNGWSIREMSRQWAIPKSTIEDWLLFTRISEERYTELIKSGKKHMDIYRELRERKAEPVQEIRIAELNLLVQTFKEDLELIGNAPEYTDQTVELIDDVIAELEDIKERILEMMGDMRHESY